MLVKPLQSANNPFIVVTQEGISMLVKPLQPEKAKSPIDVTLEGIFMLVKPLQDEYLLLVDYQYYTL